MTGKRNQRRMLVGSLLTIILALVAYRYWLGSWTADLRSVVDRADRVRIRTGGVCHRRETEEETLWDSTNLTEIHALIAMIDVNRPWMAMSCKCCGGPTFEFYSGNELLAMISRHHESGLRWPDRWDGDGHLTEDSRSRLDEWLAALAIAK